MGYPRPEATIGTNDHPRHVSAGGAEDRTVTTAELRRNTGEAGRPGWVAFEGIVYDVTGCPKWRSGLHEGLHWAGQDLTRALADAPHAQEVFTRPCVRRVGRLEG